MRLYDVCNDYSLCDKVSDKSIEVSKTKDYKWVKSFYLGHPIILGWHKEYEELHYVKSEDNVNLTGNFIPWD